MRARELATAPKCWAEGLVEYASKKPAKETLLPGENTASLAFSSACFVQAKIGRKSLESWARMLCE